MTYALASTGRIRRLELAQLHQLEHVINQDQPGRAKALIRQMVTQLDATDKATRRGEDTR